MRIFNYLSILNVVDSDLLDDVISKPTQYTELDGTDGYIILIILFFFNLLEFTSSQISTAFLGSQTLLYFHFVGRSLLRSLPNIFNKNTPTHTYLSVCHI